MTANFTIDSQGSQLFQLRWRSSSEVVRLVPTESGFVVSTVLPNATDISVTSAPRALDERTSDVFGLLDAGTKILVDIAETHTSIILQNVDDEDLSLDLIAWNVPFTSPDALIVHDICGFWPVRSADNGGLQQAAFAREGATGKVIFTRFKDGGREFYEIVWSSAGFDVLDLFESATQDGHWPDEQIPIPDFSNSPIEPGDSFAVALDESHTLELRNITRGWDYKLTPGVRR